MREYYLEKARSRSFVAYEHLKNEDKIILLASDMDNTRPVHHIIITGGNCRLPNFQARLEAELRPLVPEIYDVNIHPSDDPVRDALKGATKAILEANEEIIRTVTKQQYEELGSAAIAEHFFCQDLNT